MKRSLWIIVFGLLGPSCVAREAETRTAEPVTCATLLTAQEVKSAVAIPFNRVEVKPADPDTDSENHSSCTWQSSDSATDARIVVDFWDLETIRREPRAKGTVAGFFDMFVASRKVMSDAEPHVLEGVGERAVVYEERDVENRPVLVTYVQRRDGMSHIRAVGVSRLEAAALAKAIGESKH